MAEGELLSTVQRGLASIAAGPSRTLGGQSPPEALLDRAAKARTWLFEHALPLWWNRGYDRSTHCFFEKLSVVDGSVVAAVRRVRVQARQTYVYAQAAALGWTGPWREAVEAGCKVSTPHTHAQIEWLTMALFFRC